MQYRADRLELAAPALDEIAAHRVRDGHAPVSSWALFGPDGVAATGGAGDPAPTPATAFRVASCTKSVTAALMLVLRDEGLLQTDAPLDSLLPARFPGVSRPPTLAELATHTAGIPIDDPWADRQESVPTERLDALLADGVRLVREPGTRYEYSSLGFAILGRALEVAAGRSYQGLVADRLTGPLGLTELGFDRAGFPRIAEGFARVDGAWARQPWSAPGAFSPLGGLIATPRGLAAWAGWLAAGLRGQDDAVLAASARRELQQPHAAARGGSSYGYGLLIEQDPKHGTVVGHSGGYPGYGANMRWHAASGIGVVVTENARYSGATAPATRALRLVLDGAATPGSVPNLWPETSAARALVERLVRGADEWDSAAFADNVALDTALSTRAAAAAALRDRVGLDAGTPVADLADAAPDSDSPAHLVWSVRGTTGALRCAIRLTPETRPRIQTLEVRLG